jgi:RimJ/RimL family protein N-acetyltransferase
MINPAARQKGFGSEALKMVIDYGLNVLGLVEVRIGTPSSNVDMRRVMEVKFKMQPDDSEEKSDRFGNDLLWRIDRERWLRYLEQE